MDDITFSEKDACHIRHLHCDALVIKAMVANNNVLRILVDNRSSVETILLGVQKDGAEGQRPVALA